MVLTPKSKNGILMNDFQMIPVPNKHVTKVYAYIARLENLLEDPAEDAVDLAQPTPANGDDSGVWTDEMLAALAQSDKKAVLILCKVLDVLAASPSTWFSLDDLEGPTGETRHQLRYFWSSITRHFKNKFDTDTWPVDIQWGTDFEPRRDAVMFYRVTDERAEQWKRVTGR
jgi:hypothetical protein